MLPKENQETINPGVYKSISLGDYTLGDLQCSLLKLLDYFDTLCKQNNIKYILDSGTMLGAIRHKGFIPWDDDADVAMLRKDYKRFIKAVKKDGNPKFTFECTKTNRFYPYNFGKLRLNNTICEEEIMKDVPMNQGLWLDVFPVDKTTSLLYKMQAKLSRFFQDIRWTKLGIKRNPIFQPKHPKLLKHLSKMPYRIINLLAELSIRFLNWLPLKKVAKLCHPGKRKGPHKKDYYSDIVLVPFENLSLYVPRENREWLSNRYKSPFQYPNETDRKPSHNGGRLVL